MSAYRFATADQTFAGTHEPRCTAVALATWLVAHVMPPARSLGDLTRCRFAWFRADLRALRPLSFALTFETAAISNPAGTL